MTCHLEHEVQILDRFAERVADGNQHLAGSFWGSHVYAEGWHLACSGAALANAGGAQHSLVSTYGMEVGLGRCFVRCDFPWQFNDLAA